MTDRKKKKLKNLPRHLDWLYKMINREKINKNLRPRLLNWLDTMTDQEKKKLKNLPRHLDWFNSRNDRVKIN